MNIKVLASTHEGYIAKKEDFDIFSGHSAGICYMSSDIDALFNEPAEKTFKRTISTKNRAHHSVFGHSYISFALEDIPKGLAMVLNNEGAYNTSEKSARYTKMVLSPEEQELYNKWLERFKTLIRNEYQQQYPQFFVESRIEKLAQENARYLISVFTPTTMEYTVSYQQLNYLYQMMKNEITIGGSNAFMTALLPSMNDLCCELEKTGYIDEALANGANIKNRKLSIIGNDTPEQYFGDVYCTSYEGSFAQLAQAQRHRTIDYSFSLLNKPKFYIPPILRKDKVLMDEWLKDCLSQASKFPQGMLININEYGRLDWFIQKMKERKCTFAQLEINEQTNCILKNYAKALAEKSHPRAKELEQYTKGARCTFVDYTCPSPCGFAPGIKENRLI